MSGGSCRNWCWLIVLAACTARGDWSDCKPICQCKWISGKKSAICAKSGIRKLPTLSSDIQFIDLQDNDLGTLQKEAFASIGLNNLQRVILKSAGIQSFHKDTFRDLKILVELDLSNNDISEIPRDAFRGNERLRFLDLSRNRIQKLVADQFPPLLHLKNLDLANCRIVSVDPASLHNLRALEYLDLRNNVLKYLPVFAFDLPALKSLYLSGNPWSCDCHLRDFRTWFLASNLGNEDLLCAGPVQHADKRWRDVNETNIGCSPEVTPSSKILRSDIGSGLTFGCLIGGDPYPTVQWLYKGFDVKNTTLDYEILVYESDAINEINDDDDYNNVNKFKWNNLTITNLTSSAAGEYTCKATNIIGESSAVISIELLKARLATARTADELPTLIGAIGGAMAALAALGFVATCACWHSRSKKVPVSRSFNDQEKKLLDASISASCDRSGGEINSPTELEMMERSPSLADDNGRIIGYEPVHITIEGYGGNPGVYPPPPAEFSVPSSAGYGNIYISVQVAGGNTERYPDLLGGGATLPRRSRACCEVLAYDNMGPRVTATGSSTWSLPGSEAKCRESTLTTLTPIQVPPEFVSL